LTPTIVTQPSVGNVIRNEEVYLSGATVRGALLTAAISQRRDQVSEEVDRPHLVFHPAFPIKNGSVFKPAHPFIYKCKVCGEVRDCLADFLRDDLKIGRGVPPRLCPRGHINTLKSLQGKLLDERFQEYEPAFTRVEAVGMNKIFKTSEIGMVFSYTCLAPGTRFRGTVVDLSGTRLDVLGLTGEREVRLGRGSSRGLGYAFVRVKEEPDYLKRLEQAVQLSIEKTRPYILLKAVAPTLLPALDASKPEGLEWQGAWLAGEKRFSGFSLSTNRPKASLRCAAPGSLVAYRVGTGDSWVRWVVDTCSLGLGPFNHLGLNLLEVMGP